MTRRGLRGLAEIGMLQDRVRLWRCGEMHFFAGGEKACLHRPRCCNLQATHAILFWGWWRRFTPSPGMMLP